MTDGRLNYFTARSFEKEPYVKYRNPSASRDVIPNEHLINWNVPVILCEGLFDAIAIKRNAIPLLGKNIQSSLMKKIVTSVVDKIYIALDRDAIKQALKFCERLMAEGKEVYLVDLQDKDPSEMGFENFTKLIQNTVPLTYYDLMEQKISYMIKKSYKRLLEISDDYQQVTMPDSRYYRRNGKYYPSITHVFKYLP